MKRSRSIVHAVMVCCLAASCAPAATPVGQTEPSPTPGPTPIASAPTPEIRLGLDEFQLLPFSGGLLFLGTLENDLERGLTDLRLELELHGPDGSLAAAKSITPVPDSLAPGERSGVWTYFDRLSGDFVPSIRILSYAEGPLFQNNIEIELSEPRTSGSGRTIILGELTNLNIEYARLDDMILLPERIGEDQQGIARILLANQGLPPSEPVPFAVEVLGEIPGAGWRVFLDASPSGVPDKPPLDITAQPVLSFSAQGRPFYGFQIQNPGSLPRWLKGQIAFYLGRELLGLAELSVPVPIRPGETRAVSIDEFIGLPQRTDLSPPAMAEWRVELIIDSLASRPALAQVRLLRIEVTQFEVIGDLVFLRGTLTNGDGVTVEQPSAMITARDIGGRVLNSAWSTPQDELAPGETAMFELTMLIPAGAKAELSEFDLQGLGLAAP
jgi:hypothetical protein